MNKEKETMIEEYDFHRKEHDKWYGRAIIAGVFIGIIILMPMIITWLDDELFFHDKVPVVPFPKLRSFLRNFYLYFENLYQIHI